MEDSCSEKTQPVQQLVDIMRHCLYPLLLPQGSPDAVRVKVKAASLAHFSVPVAPPQICRGLNTAVDDVVCLLTPTDFYAISLWHDDFAKLSDQAVCTLLANASIPKKDS